jgi:AraC-like DNA-binding protein
VPSPTAYSVAVETAVDNRSSQTGTSVWRYVAYHHEGMQPGTHLGLPSPSLTVVLSVGAPTRMVAMPGPHQAPASFMALVGGLHMRPVVIGYDAVMSGIQLDLTPQGVRRLLGVPAAEVAHSIIDLDDVLGPAAGELVDRLQTSETWDARRDAVFDVLGRSGVAIGPACRHLDRAWELIVRSHGATPIDAVASAVGWSRRHLDREFVAEFGLTPKNAARLARFAYSQELLRRRPRLSMAELSDACGYFDQAHMAREWNQLAGEPASAWWADEGVRFFQAQDSSTGASSGA